MLSTENQILAKWKKWRITAVVPKSCKLHNKYKCCTINTDGDAQFEWQAYKMNGLNVDVCVLECI